MARVKLSEYRAKNLLIPSYSGVSLQLDTLDQDVAKLSSNQTYVVKVDQGIKKRGKQGLIRLNVSPYDARRAVSELAEKGFSRFIAEPMLPHDDSEERYVSFERTRGDIQIQYSEQGGVDIEEHPESVESYQENDVPLPQEFVRHILKIMDQQHMSFVEINPLIVRDNECILLDAAVLVDSAGEYQASWSENDIVEAYIPSDSEAAIAELNKSSSASFSFRMVNEDGSLWLQLMGGGACITIADEAMNQNKASLIGCFGEYSGGPTSEEIYLYTLELLKQLLTSKAPKKALVIAGGVANFSNVKTMFKGVIRALETRLDDLQNQSIKVYVRRGGPNEKEGLAIIESYLRKNDLYGSVHGSDIVLTDVVNEALEYVDA